MNAIDITLFINKEKIRNSVWYRFVRRLRVKPAMTHRMIYRKSNHLFSTPRTTDDFDFRYHLIADDAMHVGRVLGGFCIGNQQWHDDAECQKGDLHPVFDPEPDDEQAGQRGQR